MRFLDTARIRVRLDQRIVTTDGTELSVDLYLPSVAGQYPALLIRVASDNNRPGRMLEGTVNVQAGPADRWKALAAQGFIVAAADVRGRGDSDGVFCPFVHEGSDGAETVSWLRKQRECNGLVGLFGTGYAAFCAWATIAAGAQVDAIASISPFGAVGTGLCHRGGAVRLDWLFWMHLIGGRTLQPAEIPSWPLICRHLPLISMDVALGRSDIWWKDWLQHLDATDTLWQPLALRERLAARSVPGLHITGWWDGQLPAARYYFDAASQSGAPQSLLVGPWDAAAVRRPTAIVGGFDFGPRSVIDPDETIALFFKAHLGGDRAALPRPTVRLFVTGSNEWLDYDGWPGGANCVQELHLLSEGAANTRRGDGVLGVAGSCGPIIDRLTHNPAVPVEFQPTFTGFAGCTISLDQAHITARDEACVYTSATLGDALTVCGRAEVTLTLCTDAPDADLYVLLSDVFPLGLRDLHLSHTAVRLATLDAFLPGKPVTITLELDEIVHKFMPSHSIRLTVTPSLFPLYARNLHQARYVCATDPAIAIIELHHGVGAPARLRLPKY
jgi:hypothetical protein